MERMTKLKKIKRQRKHGFLARMSSHTGRLTLKRRRQKSRSRISL